MAVPTVVSVLLNSSPIVESAPVIAKAINDTSNPYSMAVAPVSLDSSDFIFCLMNFIFLPCPGSKKKKSLNTHDDVNKAFFEKLWIGDLPIF